VDPSTQVCFGGSRIGKYTVVERGSWYNGYQLVMVDVFIGGGSMARGVKLANLLDV
jgi:hypothetical protein